MEQAFAYVKGGICRTRPQFAEEEQFTWMHRINRMVWIGQDDSSLGLTGDGLDPAPAHLMVSGRPG